MKKRVWFTEGIFDVIPWFMNRKDELMRSPAWIQPKVPVRMAALFEGGKTVKLKKDTPIANEGDLPDKIFYLTEGLCSHTFAQFDDKSTTISLILPGRAIGDIFAVLDRGIFLRFDVLRDSVFKTITKAYFLEELRKDVDFTLEVMKYFADKQHSFMEGMICNSTLSTKERLTILLANLVKDNPEPENGFIKIPYKMSQELLAEVAGSSRVTVNRIMQEWFAKNLMYRKDKFLWISENFFKNC